MPALADSTGELAARGWAVFPASDETAAWIAHAGPAASAAADDPSFSQWHRHGGTWFAGVNALPNDGTGAVDGGPPLSGDAVATAMASIHPGRVIWDRGQVSICYPGYPRRDADQSEASHRYRLTRDAAHVDGLYAEGPDKRRHVRECHAFVLGIPIGPVREGQSPLVVWEGSHHIMRQALAAALSGTGPDHWHEIGVTDAYHAARRQAFATCKRIEITTEPGQTYLVHRLALHGMAPWTSASTTPRTIIYFRPELSRRRDWLTLP